MSQSSGKGGNRGQRPDEFSGRSGAGNRPHYGIGDEFANVDDESFDEQPYLTASSDNYPPAPSRMPRKPGGLRKPPPAQSVELTRIEPGKRIIALIFDSLAWYVLGMVLTVLPFIVRFVNISSCWILLLLLKDWPFEGRGVGKNLIGLQVVDAKTGQPCSLKQSVLRNIIILAPFAVLQIISVILTFVSVPWLKEAVKGVINVIGMVYVSVVLPIECYRAYSREDSLRLGDKLAGTATIESAMDFSNPFSKLSNRS